MAVVERLGGKRGNLSVAFEEVVMDSIKKNSKGKVLSHTHNMDERRTTDDDQRRRTEGEYTPPSRKLLEAYRNKDGRRTEQFYSMRGEFQYILYPSHMNNEEKKQEQK